MIGPFPDPISGVSLANKVVKEVLDSKTFFKTQKINTSYHTFEENIGKISFKKLFFYLAINLKIYKVFNNQIIYLTPGQTFYGITKYSLFILLSSLLKKDIIIHVHGNHLKNEYETLEGVKRKIFHFLISKFTKGIVLSESLKTNLTPFLKTENIHVLPNFAQDFLTKNNPPKNINEIRIIYLSNLMKEKGILIVLYALKELENRHITYKAKIAGNIDKNTSKEIKDLLSELKNTKYLGIVKGKEKKSLFDWGNIFVLPTYYKMEGQPISIIEAMATSNVIVTTKHAGIPDIITFPENGFFIKKKNIKSLTDVLIYLSENKSKLKEITKYNKTYFEKNFTLEQFRNKLIGIFNETPRVN